MKVHTQDMCERTPVVYLSNNHTAPQAIRFQGKHFKVDFLREINPEWTASGYTHYTIGALV